MWREWEGEGEREERCSHQPALPIYFAFDVNNTWLNIPLYGIIHKYKELSVLGSRGVFITCGGLQSCGEIHACMLYYS